MLLPARRDRIGEPQHTIIRVVRARPERDILHFDEGVRSGAQALLSRKFGGSVTTWLQLDLGQEEGAAAAGATAKWYAAGAWLTADLSKTAGIGLRADLVNDRDGARLSGALGYPVNAGQKVSSLTATLNLKGWDHALVRPEVRYDHSTLPVYDGHQDQFSVALGISHIF